MNLNYNETATFVKPASGGYGNSKVMEDRVDVPCIFIQSTGFTHSNFRDTINADAVCYPDPENSFVIEYFNRLEGMYILQPLFGSGDDISWYKVVQVNVNRDHLLDNVIDNIELVLKKTTPIPGVS